MKVYPGDFFAVRPTGEACYQVLDVDEARDNVTLKRLDDGKRIKYLSLTALMNHGIFVNPGPFIRALFGG